MKTLIILAHPNIDISIANKTIVNELLENNSEIEVRNIADLYKGFNIDIASEQNSLLDAKNVILQFPIQWFGVPGILKHWLDTVITLGFAHGPNGDKLEGKNLIISFTTGIPAESYEDFSKEGFNIEHINLWFKQIAEYIKMSYKGAVYECGMMPLGGQTKEQIIERAKVQAEKITKKL